MAEDVLHDAEEDVLHDAEEDVLDDVEAATEERLVTPYWAAHEARSSPFVDLVSMETVAY